MPPTFDQKKIGEILVERGLINAAQLEEVLREQQTTGKMFGEILVLRGILSEEDTAKMLSEQLGFAYVDLKSVEVEPKALELIPRDVCEKNMFIPVFTAQKSLTLAMVNPLDVNAVDKAQQITGLRIRPVFACATDIRKALGVSLSSAYAGPPDVGAGLEAFSSMQPEATVKSILENVNTIIQKAVEMGASDIHLEPEKKRFNCRFRIDGILHEQPPLPLEDQNTILSRFKIMSDMDIAEKRLPQDGRFRLQLLGRDIDLRVSTFPSLYGENMVIRILDRAGGLLRLEDMGFLEQNLKDFRKLMQRPYGMMLVTGPTGSGKTTALYAALDRKSTRLNSSH